VTGSLTTGGELGVPGPDRQASVGCDSALVPSAKSRVFVPAAPCKTVGALDGSNLWVGRDATVRTGAMSCGDRAVALPAVSAATGAVWTAAPSRFRGRCRRFQAGRRGIEGFGCPQQNQARWSVARRIRPCVASPASRGHSARTEERHRPASRHRMKARPESPARDSAKRPHVPGRVAALVGSGVSGSASASVRDKGAFGTQF